MGVGELVSELDIPQVGPGGAPTGSGVTTRGGATTGEGGGPHNGDTLRGGATPAAAGCSCPGSTSAAAGGSTPKHADKGGESTRQGAAGGPGSGGIEPHFTDTPTPEGKKW